ncbi:hypothetical protein [Pseudodesulfovibrio sp.]|uniref:NADase-type glycan-binding domain-containing protein n=1 Tax=Pseudodesulfovibrio sp. TaxID=2035812 RepID=UPI00260F6842|nr:hypothetical protein [Pseudodesulfovibrio sp.]MDD3313667.1 hypothetical protein [Pseudodesulfovibrio sp.]
MSMLRLNESLFLALAALVLACGPALAGSVAGVTADAANFQGNFTPARLVDGDPATAWVGGGTGVGPGKWIELAFPGPVRVDGLSVATGNQAAGQFGKFRRLTRGVVIFPDGTRRKFSLKPAAGEQRVPLEPRTATSLRIIITGVDPDGRDDAMGDAKVAVSEIRVLGTPEAAAETPVQTASETAAPPAAAPEAAPPAPEPAAEPAPALKPAPKAAPASAPKPGPKAAPALEAKPAPRPEPAPEVEMRAAPQPKAAPAPDVKPAQPARKEKPEAAPKKAAAPKKKAAKPAPAASDGGAITRLRPAHEVPPDRELAMGNISPWLDLELVAEIKRYFGLLTTLHDSYPSLFAPAVRERERAAFLKLQEEMRAGGDFADHHLAMLEHIGLSFDRPEEGDGRVTVRVHGPYRYYVGDKAFEFAVDSDVTLVREDGKWLILDVRDR